MFYEKINGFVGNAYTVTGMGTCTDTDVVIPSTYNDLPVTSIGERAFYGCTGLTNIKIPDNVTSISGEAFYGINFEEFKLPSKIKTLGNNIINSSKVKSIFIPKTVTSMSNAFSSLSNLEEVEFEIGDNETIININIWPNFADNFNVYLVNPSNQKTQEILEFFLCFV